MAAGWFGGLAANVSRCVATEPRGRWLAAWRTGSAVLSLLSLCYVRGRVRVTVCGPWIPHTTRGLLETGNTSLRTERPCSASFSLHSLRPRRGGVAAWWPPGEHSTSWMIYSNNKPRVAVCSTKL